MRVLQVNKFYDPRGGTERVLYDLEDGLRERGVEVAVFAGTHPDNRKSPGRLFLVPARDYEGGSPGQRLRNARGTLYDRQVKQVFSAAVAEFRPNVVHLHNIYHQFSTSILDVIHEQRIPAVMTVHDYKLVCPIYRLFRDGQICEECVGHDVPLPALRHRCSRGSFAESALLTLEHVMSRKRGIWSRAIRHFLAPSEFMAETLRAGGLPDRRVRVMKNAPRRMPEQADEGRMSLHPTLLYAGRLSPEKGVDLVVEAARRNEGVELRIAGAGPEEAGLRARAEGLRNVFFLGQLGEEDLVRERARAWATLAPSRWYENSPMSVIESWWAGRAVLGADHGGLAELIEDGVTGWAIPPADEDAWAQAFARAASSKSELARMGVSSHERAGEDHDFHHLIETLFDFYRALAPAAE